MAVHVYGTMTNPFDKYLLSDPKAMDEAGRGRDEMNE